MNDADKNPINTRLGHLDLDQVLPLDATQARSLGVDDGLPPRLDTESQGSVADAVSDQPTEPSQNSQTDQAERTQLPGEGSLTVHRMLAHNRLAYQSRIVLRLGQMLLASGASSYRVKHSMTVLARAVGIEQHHALVTYTEIVATAYAHGTFRTELAEQRSMGVNADRLDLLSNYVNSVEGKQVSIEEVDRALDAIEKIKPVYGWLQNALASGVACAGFAFLNHGGWVECSVVCVAAFFGQFLRRQMMGRKMNHFGVWIACGALASIIYVLLVMLAERYLHIEPMHQAGFISAVLFLVPGFPLVTGIIDLVRQDYQAALARLTYVVMLMISAGVSVWGVSLAFSWSVTPVYDYHFPLLTLTALRMAASFVAAYGFAMLFNSPPKVCAAAATIGTVINVGRFLLVEQMGMPVQAAVGIAALCAGLLAWMIAGKTHYSRVTLSVPAVVIMIPGVSLYRSLAYLNDGSYQGALAEIFVVFFTITSIGIGLAVSRMITDRNWLIDHPRGVPSLGGYGM